MSGPYREAGAHYGNRTQMDGHGLAGGADPDLRLSDGSGLRQCAPHGAHPARGPAGRAHGAGALFQGAGTLSREEIETEIDAELFAKLEHLIGKPLIRKERRGYRLPGGLTLEVNCVDPDLPTAFWYAEVEFETEAQALAWDPAAAGLADYLHDECTGKPGSSMGEYWLQTRK